MATLTNDELYTFCAKAANELVPMIDKISNDIYNIKPGAYNVIEICPLIGAMLAAYTVTKCAMVEKHVSNKDTRKQLLIFVITYMKTLVEENFWIGEFKH